MAEGDVFVNCATTSDVDYLIRLLLVDSDGDELITCDNNDLSLEDILKLLIVEDASGNPALAVYGVGAGGTAEHQEFTTTGGQTVFNCTITLDANYKVFVDGIFQSWGHARVGNVVTFTVPFNAGHEVSIHQ